MPSQSAAGAVKRRRKSMPFTTQRLEWQEKHRFTWLCHRNWRTAEAIVRHGSSPTVDSPDGPEDVLDWVDFTGPNVRHLSALHDLVRHWTPGAAACDFVGWLVALGGFDVDALTDQDLTPLATACAAGQFKLAHRLLSLGADCSIGVPMRATETLIHVVLRACTDMGTRRLAVNTGDDEYSELVQQLIDKGVAVDATDSNQQTALHDAAVIDVLASGLRRP
ncbi:hypothetical protein LZ30DRAFT_787409 [Colletotrichum cereale]|nr:hypothetical protein LZ30DRAFT_787409 [Colletotrichum cereale]